MILLEKNGNSIGSYAPDFELQGVDDQAHHLARYARKVPAVVSYCAITALMCG